MFSHEESVCKKKGEVRKEWRRVQRVQSENSQEEVPGECQIQQRKENLIQFTPVQEMETARHPEQAAPSSTSLLNSFHALQMDMSEQIDNAPVEGYTNG